MKISTNAYRFKSFSMLLFLFFVLPTVLFMSCDDQSSSNKDSNEYGSVAISIRISDEPAPHSDESFNRYAMAVDPSCKVRVEIMDSSSITIASGGPWDWGAGSGTVTGVPVGSDRTIIVKINDPTDSILLYQGEVNFITIYSGTTDLTDSPIFVYSTDDCAIFSGYWSITETAYSDCFGYDTADTGATIIQNGCDVTFSVDGYTGSSVGRVVGNTLSIDLPVTFTVGYEVTTYSNWSFVISGDSITGSANWEYVYDDGEWEEYCAGTSTFSGSRQQT